MQIRCYNCHKPYAMNKQSIHEALNIVTSEDLNHYNVYCPHCRRANRISIDELHRWAPDWDPKDTTETPTDE